MNVVLTNGYFIEIDKLNHTLKQKFSGKDRDGNEKESVRVCGYCRDLKQAVEMFLKNNQNELTAGMTGEFQEYVNIIEELNRNAVWAILKALDGKKQVE